MKKFTTIKELYPNDHQNFYPKEVPVREEREDSEDLPVRGGRESFEDDDLAVPEPQKRVRFANPIAETKTFDSKSPVAAKKDAFANSQDTSLKGRVMSTFKNNLINIVLLLVGFLLVSNDTVLDIIDDKITKNSIAGMAIRGLGLIVFYIAAKIAAAILFKQDS